nr:unnamed protein product [Callosobruchus analis]
MSEAPDRTVSQLTTTELLKLMKDANNQQTSEIRQELVSKIQQVSETAAETNKKVQQLEAKVQKLDRKIRRNNIVVFGLHIENKSNLLEETTTKLGNILEVGIAKADISNIYFIKQESECPPIILEFVSFLKKQESFKNVSKLKGSGIVRHLKQARKQQLPAKIRGNHLEIENHLYNAEELENLQQLADKDSEESPDEEVPGQSGTTESKTIIQKRKRACKPFYYFNTLTNKTSASSCKSTTQMGVKLSKLAEIYGAVIVRATVHRKSRYIQRKGQEIDKNLDNTGDLDNTASSGLFTGGRWVLYYDTDSIMRFYTETGTSSWWISCSNLLQNKLDDQLIYLQSFIKKRTFCPDTKISALKGSFRSRKFAEALVKQDQYLTLFIIVVILGIKILALASSKRSLLRLWHKTKGPATKVKNGVNSTLLNMVHFLLTNQFMKLLGKLHQPNQLILRNENI